MKRLIFLAVAFSLLALSCQKEDPEGIEDPFGDFTGAASAFKNGEAWSAKVRVDESNADDSSFYLTVQVFSASGLRKESLYLGAVIKNFDQQEIYSLESTDPNKLRARLYLADHDAIMDWYEVDETQSDNFIQITSYDPDLMEVEGVFHLNLLRAEETIFNSPDSITFNEGSFSATLSKPWFD